MNGKIILGMIFKSSICISSLSSLIIFLLCVQPALAQRVIGGENAQEGAYPWMVGLADASKNSLEEAHFCGGTLIDRYWVLTAAHCIDDLSSLFIDSLDVFLGANDLINPQSGYERIRVKNSYVHPAFGSGSPFQFDIALLELSSPSDQFPIELADQGDESLYDAGTPAKVLGWGLKNTNFDAATYLQEAAVEMIDIGVCNGVNAYNGGISSDMVCAGYQTGQQPAGAASGDSGGPLFVRIRNGWTQTGIVSWGERLWTTDVFPGVYQKVANHRNWIEDTIANNPVKSEEIPTVYPDFTVYTNKESLFIHSKVAIAAETDVYLVDFMGRILKREPPLARSWTEHEINLNGLPFGVYVLVIAQENTIISKRFLRSF